MKFFFSAIGGIALFCAGVWAGLFYLPVKTTVEWLLPPEIVNKNKNELTKCPIMYIYYDKWKRLQLSDYQPQGNVRPYTIKLADFPCQ